MKYLIGVLGEILLENRTSEGKFAIGTMLAIFGSISILAWHLLPIMIGLLFTPILVLCVYSLKCFMHDIGLKHMEGGK